MRPSSLFYGLSAIAIISAQNLSQETDSQLAAQLPSCVLPCDKAAIASVGCRETDYACHCAHSSQLQSIVVLCLQNSLTCSSSDLQTFGTLVKQICLNINVTGNGTSTSTVTSASPTSSATVVPFPGAASHLQMSGGVVAKVTPIKGKKNTLTKDKNDFCKDDAVGLNFHLAISKPRLKIQEPGDESMWKAPPPLASLSLAMSTLSRF
ncbi:hypothetical protein NA56DRAFT_745836 [Hyaloscypha hepaticicola]|uniref:CFEM domain-containing protein n=1 Tax=Hyaloscypha hepaticicola TaxID=2082293 RepID=A0A2J6QDT2_9HELO|nr:hypothetical protein NA56DRAFT_745836 [Hyaloscypha hepaticicola]